MVEIEKLKLNQARALPLILSGLTGAVLAYLVVRADMQLEKENAKYLKFELDQIWQARVREVQSSLDQVRDERNELAKKLSEKKPAGWLEIAGRRVF